MVRHLQILLVQTTEYCHDGAEWVDITSALFREQTVDGVRFNALEEAYLSISIFHLILRPIEKVIRVA